MGDNLTQTIRRHATVMPFVDAVIEMKKNRGGHVSIGRRLSFEALDKRIDQYAAKFLEKGVQRSSRVLMLIRPGIEMICTFFSLVRIGAIPILIDSGVGLKELVRLGNLSKPDFIACGPGIRWLIFFRFMAIKGKAISVRRSFGRCSKVVVTVQNVAPEDMIAILFTSGSTGAAKGVVYKQRNFEDQLRKLQMTYCLKSGTRDVTLLPVFILFNPMFGQTSIIPDMDFSHPAQFHVPSIVETIFKNGAKSSFGAPILWSKIADYCFKNDIKIFHLEQIFLAGVSVTTEVLDKIQAIAPNANIFTPYGATECLPICSVSAKEILDEIRPLQENGAGTCLGFSVEGIEIKILVPTEEIIENFNECNVLPLGHIGEIVVSGGNVTELYDQLPEKTALTKIYQNGSVWHRTGDLGFLDEKGRLWFCGRKAECVVAEDGEEYYPDCIEPLFCKYSAVERAALIKITRHGKVQPAIAIVPKPDQYPFFFWEKWKFRRKLKDLAQCFPKTVSIRNFFFCRSFPVDPRHNAKIHRLALGKKFSR